MEKPEKRSHIKQIRDPDSSDSDEGTISADESAEDSCSEDTTFELKFFRNQLSVTEANCKQVKIEKAYLMKKLNVTEEFLQQERMRSRKMRTRLRRTTSRNSNRKDSAVKAQKSKILAPPEAQPSVQNRVANLEAEVRSLKNSIEWLETISGQKRDDDAVSCGINVTLSDCQESKSIPCSGDLYEELTNIKNSICCKLEEGLLNESQVINLYSNVLKLCMREVAVLRQYKNVAEERLAQMEVQKNSFSETLAFCESFSREQTEAFNRTKERALVSTSGKIEALNELLKCKEVINELTNSLETERKSSLNVLQDVEMLSDENRKLVNTIVELREETNALSSHVSEISGTLTRNNEQISQLNSENEHQVLEISTMYKTISTLKLNLQQLSSEKDAILQCHSKCAPLRREMEDLRACYSIEHDKNVDLSNELAVSKIKITGMEQEISNLYRQIDQLKLYIGTRP